MNPDAVMTFTPFDVRFSRWLYQESGWTEKEKDQVLAEYLEVRALEGRDPEDTEGTLRVIHAFEERERQFKASLITPEAFRRHEIAFFAGLRANSVANSVALIVERLGSMDFDRFSPVHKAAERDKPLTRYQFSPN